MRIDNLTCTFIPQTHFCKGEWCKALQSLMLLGRGRREAFQPFCRHHRTRKIHRHSAAPPFPEAAPLCSAYEVLLNLWSWFSPQSYSLRNSSWEEKGGVRVLPGGPILAPWLSILHVLRSKDCSCDLSCAGLFP